MARKAAFTIVQEFLGKFEPSAPEVRETLGISQKPAEIFWAALSAVEEGDKNLKIANLPALAKGVAQFYSIHLNKLLKRKLIQRGKKQGEYFIAREAIKRLSALLRGEMVQASVTPRLAKKKAGKKRVSRKAARNRHKAINNRPNSRDGRKLVGGISKSIAAIKSRLAELDGVIKQATEERAAIVAQLASITDS